MPMPIRAGFVLACATAVLAIAVGACAQTEPPRGGNPQVEVLANTCLGCHGIPSYKNAYPTYSVPKLAGQHPQYLANALKAYKSGERGHATMNAQAVALSDRDIAEVAAHLAGRQLEPGAEPVGTPPQITQTCAACHGLNGVGLTPDYPTLAGQHEDYIARALHEYKKGGRKNPIMAGFAAQLSEADIQAASEYYARQRPALQTLAKPFTVLSRAE